MKKYLFGLLAVTIAIGSVAFTSSARFATVFLEFKGNPQVVNDIQNEALWQEVNLGGETPQDFCNSISNDRACVIEVLDTYTSGTAGSRVMKPASTGGIDILAVTGSLAGYYVPTESHPTRNFTTVANKDLP
jgi:hypothetical protein